MKRSEINRHIREASAFLAKHRFPLPPWAHWSPAEWRTKGPECNEIRENALGWDLTDFGSGDFLKQGLTLVTLRNGNPKKGDKVYCEKIMFVREHQVTPIHFHWLKTEDIINRGGGTLCMRLWKANPAEELTDEPITAQVDGVTTVIAGDAVKNISEMARGVSEQAVDKNAAIRSIRIIRELASAVIPGHDRVLALDDTAVTAINQTGRRIVMPPHVAAQENGRFDLQIHPGTMRYSWQAFTTEAFDWITYGYL